MTKVGVPFDLTSTITNNSKHTTDNMNLKVGVPFDLDEGSRLKAGDFDPNVEAGLYFICYKSFV